MIGDRITFVNVGAYSIAKANAFNGINLPDVYVVGADGDCRRCPSVGYDEYKKIWGRA
jgi:carboxynorspermidine decarboxylase